MADAVEHGHGHGDGHHDPNLQHHFEDLHQQFDASKLGMWLFLVTEILFFAGLFCAYAVYRRTHPEIFDVGQHFLDVKMGAINTAVLITSSFTMALGVWCAQKSYQKGLIVCLVLTLMGAAGFMVIKYFEYTHKFHEGKVWGANFYPLSPEEAHARDARLHGGAHDAGVHAAGEHAEDGHGTDSHAENHGEDPHAPSANAGLADGHGQDDHADDHDSDHGDGDDHDATSLLQPAAAATGGATYAETLQLEESSVPAAARGPDGLVVGRDLSEAEREKAEKKALYARAKEMKDLRIFMGIYYCMTGLHGIHVVAGMVVITWLLVGAVKGRYHARYYTPVDLVGLYWHVVDLVWIFLFPLFYLID